MSACPAVPGALLQSHGRCPGAGWTWGALGVEVIGPPNPEGAGSPTLVTALTRVSGEACSMQEAVGTFTCTLKNREDTLSSSLGDACFRQELRLPPGSQGPDPGGGGARSQGHALCGAELCFQSPELTAQTLPAARGLCCTAGWTLAVTPCSGGLMVCPGAREASVGRWQYRGRRRQRGAAWSRPGRLPPWGVLSGWRCQSGPARGGRRAQGPCKQPAAPHSLGPEVGDPGRPRPPTPLPAVVSRDFPDERRHAGGALLPGPCRRAKGSAAVCGNGHQVSGEGPVRLGRRAQQRGPDRGGAPLS